MQDQPEVLHETLDLSFEGVTSKDGVSLGHLTVSAVFRPVDSVALSGECIFTIHLYVYLLYTVPNDSCFGNSLIW